MSPEHLVSNMWRLEGNEFISGRRGDGKHKLSGPQVVRIHEYPTLGDKGMMRIQGDVSIEVDGLNFPDLVEQVQEEK